MRGLSFSEIAAELCKLGRRVSRNAVIGRAKRVGLPPRPRKGNTKPKPKKTIIVSGRALAKVSAWKPAVEDTPTPSAAGPHLGLQVIELEPAHCRYPEGEGSEITFCGQPALLDSAYCDAHDQLCHIRRSGHDRGP